MDRTFSSGLTLPDQAASTFLVSDELWAKIQQLLPVHENPRRFGGGRPRRSDRDCLNAILFHLRTGCQWKALSATGICPSSTAHDRFPQWNAAGVFLEFWRAGLLAYDELQGLDWTWLSMDGVMTKAPLGGKTMRRQPHRPGQTRRQAVAIDRGLRRAAGPGRRRGQSPRLSMGEGNAR
jgi:putative transposase